MPFNRGALFGSFGQTFIATITVTGPGPVNLRSLADAAGYDGASDATVTYNLAEDVTGSPTGGHGITTGTWPAGVDKSLTLNLNSGADVRGGGGSGGDGGSVVSGINGEAGEDGGDAIHCLEDITINVNTGSSVLAAGGGGGGGGGSQDGSPEFSWYGGGGGGGGYPNGAGGSGGEGEIPIRDGNDGSSGTLSGGGVGGGAGRGGAGGAGGDLNTIGVSGSNGGGGALNGVGGAPGQPGYAIRENGNSVTVNNTGGTITGTVG